MTVRVPLRNCVSDAEKAAAVAMYKEGVGAETIARKLGIMSHVIRKFLKSQGLTRTQKESMQQQAFRDTVGLKARKAGRGK